MTKIEGHYSCLLFVCVQRKQEMNSGYPMTFWLMRRRLERSFHQNHYIIRCFKSIFLFLMVTVNTDCIMALLNKLSSFFALATGPTTHRTRTGFRI